MGSTLMQLSMKWQYGFGIDIIFFWGGDKHWAVSSFAGRRSLLQADATTVLAEARNEHAKHKNTWADCTPQGAGVGSYGSSVSLPYNMVKLF
jgi:hypothetical protein